MRVYCDTCVYIDALELNKNDNRVSKRLADFAWAFFDRVKNEEHTLVISDWVIEEFRKVTGREEELRMLINNMGNVMNFPVDSEDRGKSKKT